MTDIAKCHVFVYDFIIKNRFMKLFKMTISDFRSRIFFFFFFFFFTILLPLSTHINEPCYAKNCHFFVNVDNKGAFAQTDHRIPCVA